VMAAGWWILAGSMKK